MAKLQRFLNARSAGQKFLCLWLICLICLFIKSLALIGFIFAFALLLYPLFGISLRHALLDLRFVLWMSVFYFFFQLITQDAPSALASALRLYALFLFASLLSRTTTTSELMEVFERALSFLRYVKCDARKFSFTLSLTIRFIPLFIAILREVKEAQAARGLERNILALFIPVLMRILTIHDQVSQALEARSYPPQ